MSQKTYQVEISVIFPTRNEGPNVSKVLDELITELDKAGRSYEIIALDSPSNAPSIATLKQYADRYDTITAVNLLQGRAAGNDKAVKYMIGFKMARGKYIIQIDSDGQDNPADIHKFIKKLDEGVDLVVGHKQKRKDGKIYMLTSKIANTLTRIVSGVNIHDMNCGFKGYQHDVAKSLNIKGRWYRFIPALVAAKGHSIQEVPIENRKREWGKTNFSFRNRLEGGLFDQLNVVLVTKIGETPAYLLGWTGLGFKGLFLLSLLAAFLSDKENYKVFFIVAAMISIALSFMLMLAAALVEYLRYQIPVSVDQYGIDEVYVGKQVKANAEV